MITVHHQAAEAINERRSELAAQVVALQLVRHPELERRYGRLGRKKCAEDAGYHLAYLAQAIAAAHPGLFENYIAWVKVMLAERGVPSADLAGMLETMKDALPQELVPEFSRVACDYVDSALRQLPQMPDSVPSFLAEGTPLTPLAAEYLTSLLRGERHVASRLILDAVEHGTPVREIYLHVFQRTQHEIGRLWQLNQISVAQEHYCTAATQLVMSQLYPHVFADRKVHGTVVATCVAGDLHEIGARMVSDFLEMEGWQTHYLGANVPTASVVESLVRLRADALAISATIAYHVGTVGELISAVRRTPECDAVKILAGGYPFQVAPELWRQVGADGCAVDAQEATALLHRLTGRAFQE